MFGWIALYRAIMEHWIWNTSPQRLKRWIYILFCVAWQEKVVGFGDKEVTLKRGQMVTSIRRLMGMWNTNSTTVRNTLDSFVEHGMIEVKTEPKMTIITVLNYDKYQQGNEDQEQFLSFPAFPPPRAQDWEQGWAQNKEEINNNIINNNDNSQPFTREEDFFEEYIKSDLAIEYAMRDLGLDKEGVLLWFEKFKDYCIYRDKCHKDFTDFKLHFVSWVNSRKNGQDGNREQEPSQRDEDKRSARRGTDAGDKSEEDYDDSF